MTHHHHNHHHGHGQGEETCSCCCHEHTCDQHHHHHEEQDFSSQLLELADEAWMELLKEKIKKQIEASGGKHLDQLAKLVAESNKEHWNHKLALKKVDHEYKEKLSGFFQNKHEK